MRPSLDLPDVDGLIVALDTETSGLYTDPGDKGNARVSIVTLAWYASGVVGEGDTLEERCYAFDQGALDKPNLPRKIQGTLFDGDAPNLPEEEWDVMVAWLKRQFFVFHNAKFDLHIMRVGHRKWGKGVDLSDRTVWDTQVINPLCFPGEKTGLKPTAVRLWGEDEDLTKRQLDSWLRKNDYRFDLAPWELVAPYATEDATKTMRLYAHQLAMINEGEVPYPWRVINREIDLAICLYRMEKRGVPFDAEGCRQEAVKLGKAADKIERELALAWGKRPTPAAAKWWFGTDSADMETISSLVAKKVPYAELYQRLAKLRSALSKWYEGWPAMTGDDGRLRCNYHQVKRDGVKGGGQGVVSGRLSVERVQLHAIPHDFRLPPGVRSVRSFFKAPPGKELWEVDIGQAEVRVATHLARCEPMRAVLVDGGDLHGQTCKTVFGIGPDHPQFSKFRTLAKRLTFATLYAAGPRTFRNTLITEAGIVETEDQCKAWLDDYRAAFPQFKQMERRTMALARSRKYLRLVTGRHRWFDEKELEFYAYKAFNQLVQGNVAEAMRIIKVEVEAVYPGILLNEVHDSLMLEVPAGEEGQKVVYGVELLMIEILSKLFGGWSDRHRVPWVVDSKRWEEKD